MVVSVGFCFHPIRTLAKMVMPFKSLIFRKETVLEKKDDLFKLLISENQARHTDLGSCALDFSVRGAISFGRGCGGDYSDSLFPDSIMHMCVKGDDGRSPQGQVSEPDA